MIPLTCIGCAILGATWATGAATMGAAGAPAIFIIPTGAAGMDVAGTAPDTAPMEAGTRGCVGIAWLTIPGKGIPPTR